MKTFLKKIAHVFFALFERLLQSHPWERERGVAFTEEARAERLANLIRFSYALMWLGTTAFYIPNNVARFNAINMVSGFILLFFAVSYHALLARQGYKPSYKYFTTTLDMVIAVGVLVAYAVAAGPVFVLKLSIYLTVPCGVGLAALRIHRLLAIYAGVLAFVLLLGFWAWMEVWYGIDYGTRMEHAFGSKVAPTYLIDTLVFMMAFVFLGIAGAYNMRRQVNLRLIEAERTAREEERALMAAGLAHEIRNPLSGIFGAAQLLRETSAGPEGGTLRYTGIIFENVNRLRLVADGFLNFARPFPVRSVPVDLIALADEFCGEQSRLLPEIPVQCLHETGPVRLSTDPEAVLQILLNLLQNARRYQPKGVPVRLRVGLQSEGVSLAIEDDGPGVGKEMLPHLFSPFQSRSAGGTGLGLAISQKIARALGGDLKHEPSGTGARFVLFVPDLSRRST